MYALHCTYIYISTLMYVYTCILLMHRRTSNAGESVPARRARARSVPPYNTVSFKFILRIYRALLRTYRVLFRIYGALFRLYQKKIEFRHDAHEVYRQKSHRYSQKRTSRARLRICRALVRIPRALLSRLLSRALCIHATAKETWMIAYFWVHSADIRGHLGLFCEYVWLFCGYIEHFCESSHHQSLFRDLDDAVFLGRFTKVL